MNLWITLIKNLIRAILKFCTTNQLFIYELGEKIWDIWKKTSQFIKQQNLSWIWELKALHDPPLVFESYLLFAATAFFQMDFKSDHFRLIFSTENRLSSASEFNPLMESVIHFRFWSPIFFVLQAESEIVTN